MFSLIMKLSMTNFVGDSHDSRRVIGQWVEIPKLEILSADDAMESTE